MCILEPDVIIFFCNPAQALILTQAYMRGGGKKINTSMTNPDWVAYYRLLYHLLKKADAVNGVIEVTEGNGKYEFVISNKREGSGTSTTQTDTGLTAQIRLCDTFTTDAAMSGYLLTTPRDVPKMDET